MLHNYYSPSFTTKAVIFLPTSRPSLDVQFTTSLKSNLHTALTTHNTKLQFIPMCCNCNKSLACSNRVNVGLAFANLLSMSRPIS